jgi:hypothetical protein
MYIVGSRVGPDDNEDDGNDRGATASVLKFDSAQGM